MTPSGVNKNLPEASALGVSTGENPVQDQDVARTGHERKKDPPAEVNGRPVADRIRAYVEERQGREPDYSIRRLSADAGLNPSQLSNILVRLDSQGGVEWKLLARVARAMGRSLDWLTTGENLGRLCDAPGWDAAVEQALREHPHLDRSVIATVGALRAPSVPRLDAHLVIALVLGWSRK
jgi:hypothetical protein